jgi:hypothetical protein
VQVIGRAIGIFEYGKVPPEVQRLKWNAWYSDEADISVGFNDAGEVMHKSFVPVQRWDGSQLEKNSGRSLLTRIRPWLGM